MHGTVLDWSAKITALTAMEQIECSMSGESDLVYTSQTNQASTSMSGSYGVSGVAKLSAAVSAYAGYSSASSSKSINVTYQILVAGGVGTSSFDSLSPALLMAALASGPRHKLGKVLDSYGDLIVWCANGQCLTGVKVGTLANFRLGLQFEGVPNANIFHKLCWYSRDRSECCASGR
jgi:hypothetical protein